MVQSINPTLTAPLAGTELVTLWTPGTTNLFATSNAIAQQAGASPFLDTASSISAAVSGFSLTMSNAQSTQIISLTQTTAAGTVTLPAAPLNRQVATIAFNQNITALTVTASTTSQTIKFAPVTTSTQSTGDISFIYNTSDTTWYTY